MAFSRVFIKEECKLTICDAQPQQVEKFKKSNPSVKSVQPDMIYDTPL